MTLTIFLLSLFIFQCFCSITILPYSNFDSKTDVFQHRPLFLDISTSTSSFSTQDYYLVDWGDGTFSDCDFKNSTYSHAYSMAGTFVITVFQSDDPSSCISTLSNSPSYFTKLKINVIPSDNCFYFQLYYENSPIDFINVDPSIPVQKFDVKIHYYNKDDSELPYNPTDMFHQLGELPIISSSPLNPPLYLGVFFLSRSDVEYNSVDSCWFFTISVLSPLEMDPGVLTRPPGYRSPTDQPRYFRLSIQSTGVEHLDCQVGEVEVNGMVLDDFIDFSGNFLGNFVENNFSLISQSTNFLVSCDSCTPSSCLGYLHKISCQNFNCLSVVYTRTGFNGIEDLYSLTFFDLSRHQTILSGIFDPDHVISSEFSICFGLPYYLCESLQIFEIKLINGLNRFIVTTSRGPVLAVYSEIFKKLKFSKLFPRDDRIVDFDLLSKNDYSFDGGFGCGVIGYNYGKKFSFYNGHNLIDSAGLLTYSTDFYFSEFKIISIPFGIRLGSFGISNRYSVSAIRCFTIGMNVYLLTDSKGQNADVIYHFDGESEVDAEFTFVPSSSSQFDPSSGWFTSVFAFPTKISMKYLQLNPSGSGLYAVGKNSLWYSTVATHGLQFVQILDLNISEEILKFSVCFSGNYFVSTNFNRIFYGSTSPPNFVFFEAPSDAKILSEIFFDSNCVPTIILIDPYFETVSIRRFLLSAIISTFSFPLSVSITPSAMSSKSWLYLSSHDPLSTFLSSNLQLSTSLGMTGLIEKIDLDNNRLFMQWPFEIPEFMFSEWNCGLELSGDFLGNNWDGSGFRIIPGEFFVGTLGNSCNGITTSEQGKSIVFQDLFGTVAKSMLSGSALITEIIDLQSFHLVAVNQIHLPFSTLFPNQWTLLSLSPVNLIGGSYDQSLALTFVDLNQYTAQISPGILTFQSNLIGLFLFHNEELIGKVVSIASSSELLFQSFSIISDLIFDPTTWHFGPLNSLDQFSFTFSPSLTVSLPSCPYKEVSFPELRTIIFDRGESVTLSFKFYSENLQNLWDTKGGKLPSILFFATSNTRVSELFYNQSIAGFETSQDHLPFLSANLSINGRGVSSPFAITSWSNFPLTCPFPSSFDATFVSNCPPFRFASRDLGNKTLDIFDPVIMEPLPVNYRPPSRFGAGIPVSKNIYNADPSVPKYFDIDPRSIATGSYKQCAGKNRREDCDCSPSQANSQWERDSDCITHAYRVFFGDGFLPLFHIMESGEFHDVINSKYFLEELNNRTDYCFFSEETTLDCFDKEAVSKYHASFGDFIVFSGAELYHFRITFEADSFCNFQTEFLIWVFEPPAHSTVVWSTISITGITIAAVLYFYYFLGLKKTGRRFE
ncbi:hypothetical protein RCL1_005663 [Eukaryota sp. TZLM3-RCL]